MSEVFWINKLNIKQSSVSTEIYKDLICAENCNVVALTGTPLINYPCELGVLFNIVGGSNVVIEIACSHKNTSKINKKQIMDALKTLQLIDYIEYELPSRKLKNKNYVVNCNAQLNMIMIQALGQALY